MNADAATSINHKSPKEQKYTQANLLCIHMTRNTQIHTCVNVNILLHLVRPRCTAYLLGYVFAFTCARLHK